MRQRFLPAGGRTNGAPGANRAGATVSDEAEADGAGIESAAWITERQSPKIGRSFRMANLLLTEIDLNFQRLLY
jgi:hypothetical protein